MTLDLGYGATIIVFLAVFGALLGIKLMLTAIRAAVVRAVFTASAIRNVISDFIERTLGLG